MPRPDYTNNRNQMPPRTQPRLPLLEWKATATALLSLIEQMRRDIEMLKRRG